MKYSVGEFGLTATLIVVHEMALVASLAILVSRAVSVSSMIILRHHQIYDYFITLHSEVRKNQLSIPGC
jgi:hypothetical protein